MKQKGYTSVKLFTAHFVCNRIFGFTLAEVLITLGIIGVVAAMTFPALVNNIQKKVLQTQFKKSYNTIFNAYRQAEAQLGYHVMCYYGDDNVGAPCLEYENGNCIKYGEAVNPTNQGSDCTVLRNELLKTLKVIKICKGNAVTNGCIPPYKGNDKIIAERPGYENATEEELNRLTSGQSGWRTNNIHNKCHAWVLNDGTIILWYGSSTTLFAVDVNGKKNPNKWGYDIFAFSLTSNLTKALWLNGHNFIEEGGVTTTTMLKNINK